ncbi:hypothetical protein GTGU_01252 [Trabulsiella guamensis ATCC 49490]|uniref:Uncharacterized protein n=1 Tax=Trabulsiella guamensis ATCC 49490 TaxID=1005994 RepID=A0A085AF40_9ENTR|nr:hypothetical protein GTGU_01252 [Trabulsiella guamensis ATCC 49490]
MPEGVSHELVEEMIRGTLEQVLVNFRYDIVVENKLSVEVGGWAPSVSCSDTRLNTFEVLSVVSECVAEILFDLAPPGMPRTDKFKH